MNGIQIHVEITVELSTVTYQLEHVTMVIWEDLT